MITEGHGSPTAHPPQWTSAASNPIKFEEPLGLPLGLAAVAAVVGYVHGRPGMKRWEACLLSSGAAALIGAGIVFLVTALWWLVVLYALLQYQP
jgi:hypothetical protein